MNIDYLFDQALEHVKAVVPNPGEYSVSVQATIIGGMGKFSKTNYWICLRDKEGNYVANGAGYDTLQSMGEFVTNVRKWQETGEFQESRKV